MRQRPPVCGGDARIGGDRVELTDSSGSQYYGRRIHEVAVAAARQDRHSGNAVAALGEVYDLGVLQQLDQRVRAHDLGQAPDQRRTGPVAAGVDDPRLGVGRLQAESEPAVGAAIEPGAQR